jgi:hypothetical protein
MLYPKKLGYFGKPELQGIFGSTKNYLDSLCLIFGNVMINATKSIAGSWATIQKFTATVMIDNHSDLC